jgi:ABC-type thiamine transport system substrate-binding protein
MNKTTYLSIVNARTIDIINALKLDDEIASGVNNMIDAAEYAIHTMCQYAKTAEYLDVSDEYANHYALYTDDSGSVAIMYDPSNLDHRRIIVACIGAMPDDTEDWDRVTLDDVAHNADNYLALLKNDLTCITVRSMCDHLASR